MAAFILITMASVQCVYIDREIQAVIMSETCLQLLFSRIHCLAFQHTRMLVARYRRTNANPENIIKRRFKKFAKFFDNRSVRVILSSHL